MESKKIMAIKIMNTYTIGMTNSHLKIIYLCVEGYGLVCHRDLYRSKENSKDSVFFLPLCGSQGLNSAHWAW